MLLTNVSIVINVKILDNRLVNRVKQYNKQIIHYKQERFIPQMQIYFIIRNLGL